MTTTFDDEGWVSQEVIKKLKKNGRLDGDEAIAYIACSFSNATHNNYSPEDMVNRVSFEGYRIIVEKV